MSDESRLFKSLIPYPSSFVSAGDAPTVLHVPGSLTITKEENVTNYAS
jgi:hypothetical protein